MKILFITSYYKPAYIYGGPARSIPALCEGLSLIGAGVTVFTTNANGSGALNVPVSKPVYADGVQVWYFPRERSRWALEFYSAELARACEQEIRGFDAVYICATWTYPMLAASKAARQSGIPYVVSPRGSFMARAMSQKWLKKRVYLSLCERKRIDAAVGIHCTSALEAEQTRRFAFKPPIFTVPNPVDLPLPTPSRDRSRIRAELGVPENGTLSICVGRKHVEKRLDLAVEAFARLALDLPSARLALVGPDQGAEGELRQLAQRLNVRDKVIFIGLTQGDRVQEIYAAADVLLMLSWRESFGMAAAEALAAGVPVLLSEDVGLAEELGSAGVGRVARPLFTEIHHVWREMLADPRLREMGIRGRSFAAEHFSSRAVAGKMLAAFQDLGVARAV
jgi:glycosyltransferase involved in cell wall biosynthesis